MRGGRLRRMGAALAALVMTTSMATAAAATPEEGPRDRIDVIVTLADGVGSDRAAEVANAHRATLGFVYRHALRGFSAEVPAGRLNGLERDPRVASVDLDLPVFTTAQTVPTGIARVDADLNDTVDIDGSDDLRVDVDVAIVDTGIDAAHPDLNVAGGTDCARKGPFNSSCRDGRFADGDGHGTHVAGTVGALDNGIGVVGVAPGARLWGVKVLDDSGSGYTSWIIAGIDWVIARGDIEVLNMSLGGPGRSTAYRDAIDNAVGAGVSVVVAAGNSAADAYDYSPAFVPSAVTVSSVSDSDGAPGGVWSGACTSRAEAEDHRSTFSNFGTVVDLAAPGDCILSTVPGGGYAEYSGTSMAAPHVAGAMALLRSTGAAHQNALGTLLSRGTYDWTDTSPDGVKEPLLNVASVDAAMLSTGGGGGGDGGGDAEPKCSKGRQKKGLC